MKIKINVNVNVKQKMGSTSWIVHAGSQYKSSGQSNTSFDLDLNQCLEFDNTATCSLTNINIPNTFPNVSDAFGNRTWSFTFRYFAVTPTQDPNVAGVGTATRPFYTYTALAFTSMLKEYTMTVSIPEGFYAVPYDANTATLNENIPAIAQTPFPLEQLARLDYGTPTARDIDTTNYHKLRSEFIQIMHKHGIGTVEQSRTYVEALQKAIWQEQQRLRNNALYGYANPVTANTDAEVSRIMDTLISEMVIVPIINKYHQLEFLIRSNFANGHETAAVAGASGPATVYARGTNINVLLANSNYFPTNVAVNPWSDRTTAIASGSAAPTHCIQCKITAPTGVRFSGKSVTNCLDFYNLAYKPLNSDAIAVPSAQMVGGDVYQLVNAAFATPNAAPTKAGDFTAYGTTWTTHSILRGRTDPLKDFTLNTFNREDGWFNCAIWGVLNGTAAGVKQQGVYMYSTCYAKGEANKYVLHPVNQVQQNRTASSSYTAWATVYERYPSGADSVPTKSEYITDVFTGTTVRVSPNELSSNATAYFSWDNLFATYKSIMPMDVIEPPVFNIEVDMFGVSNHIMFTGKQEAKRVKLLKRVTGNGVFGEIIKNNEENQDIMDYGTNVGMTRVNNIQVRVKDNSGNVITFSDPTAFPDWFFTLIFKM